MRYAFVKSLITLSVSAVLVVVSSGVGNAQGRVDPTPDGVASQIDRAADAAGVDDSRKNSFSREGEATAVKAGGSSKTSISSARGGNSVVHSFKGEDFAVSLPGRGGEKEVSSDGSTVVLSDPSDTQHFVTAVSSVGEESARAQTVLLDTRAGARYTYGFENADSIELNSGGGASVFAGQGASKAEVATVKPAWARDANGRAVPTHYEVSGNRLVQVVEHAKGGFAYPIVADPSWSSVWSAIKKGGSKVASAAKWLGSKASWVVGKTWSGVTTVAPKGYKAGKFLVKKAGPLGVALCAVGGSWAWYRSDGKGIVRVGDAVSGCLV